MRDITLNIDIRAVIKRLLANDPRRGRTVILNDVIFRKAPVQTLTRPMGEACYYHTDHWLFEYYEVGSFKTYQLKYSHPTLEDVHGQPMVFNIVLGEQPLTFKETDDLDNVLVITSYGVETNMPKTLANLLIKYGNKDIKYVF